MGAFEIILLISIIVLVVGVGIYFLNRWASKKAAMQQDMIQQHKQSATIYVIDKKKDKITNANFPKAIAEQIPRRAKLMKMPLVKAKIGPQIMTLICDEAVFKALPIKKTVTVDVAGAYIVGMKGQKTKMELAKQRQARRKKPEGESETPMKWHEKLRARIGR